MDLSVNLDMGRVETFHKALINQSQASAADERTLRAWQESDERHERAMREERRQQWVAHHKHLSLVFSDLAAEHEAKAATLLAEGGTR